MLISKEFWIKSHINIKELRSDYYFSRFWDSSSTCMQSLYKIKTAKFFEKVKKKDPSTEGANLDEDPFSITHITLCTESRLLAIAGKVSKILRLIRMKKHKSIFENVIT